MGGVQEIAIQLALNQTRYLLDIKETVLHLQNKLTQGLTVDQFRFLQIYQVENERSYQKNDQIIYKF